MDVALCVLSDGRFDYLMETLESLNESNDLPFKQKMILVDGNPGAASSLRDSLKEWQIWTNPGRSGLAQSVKQLWKNVNKEIKYIFHLEEDFTFNEYIDIYSMIKVLDNNPHLAQMLLKRQPWGSEEPKYGGYVEMNPDSYIEKTDGINIWCEHRNFFSLNPCVIPRKIFDLGWHEDNERGFAQLIFEDKNMRCGLWGAKFDPPKVHHIGIIQNHGGIY
jgi:hypothetical protein